MSTTTTPLPITAEKKRDKQLLENSTLQCNNFKDIIPFLKAIPLQSIQQFVVTQIKEFNPTKMKYYVLSINDILAGDIIEYINQFLCFDASGCGFPSVCKLWKKIYDQTMKNKYKTLNERFEKV